MSSPQGSPCSLGHLSPSIQTTTVYPPSHSTLSGVVDPNDGDMTSKRIKGTSLTWVSPEYTQCQHRKLTDAIRTRILLPVRNSRPPPQPSGFDSARQLLCLEIILPDQSRLRYRQTCGAHWVEFHINRALRHRAMHAGPLHYLFCGVPYSDYV